MEKVAIIGSGIAGWTAAIYAARALLSPVIITGQEEGGQLMLTTEVENYPGFIEGIMGPELMENCKKQAERFGAKVIMDAAIDFKKRNDHYEIKLKGGDRIQSKAVIIATGATAKWLGLPAEQTYKGRGVHTCATCDAFFYKDKEVIVVGGGDSAMEEAKTISKFASKVIVVHRRDSFRASKIMQDHFFKDPKASVIWDTVIEDILGNGKTVTGVKLKNAKTGKVAQRKIDGIFLAIGHVPNTGIFEGILEMDEQGYLVADRFMRTNLSGVFAAGDVQDKRYRQAITAAGSGCQAALEAEKYLEGIQG